MSVLAPVVPGFVTLLAPPITTVTSSPASTLAPIGTPMVRVSVPAPVRLVDAVAVPPGAATVTSAVVSPVVPVPAVSTTMMVEPFVGFRAALVVNVTVYSVAAPATRLVGVAVGVPWMAPVIETAAAVSSSMGVLALSCVWIVRVPVDPVTVGFLMPESTMLPVAPPARVVPLVRVNVTTCPDTPIVPTPSRVPPTLTKAAAETSKFAGKVIAISPLLATGLAVVKVAVTLPVAPATSDAGTTLVADSAPTVIVSAATAVSISIWASALVVVSIV